MCAFAASATCRSTGPTTGAGVDEGAGEAVFAGGGVVGAGAAVFAGAGVGMVGGARGAADDALGADFGDVGAAGTGVASAVNLAADGAGDGAAATDVAEADAFGAAAVSVVVSSGDGNLPLTASRATSCNWLTRFTVGAAIVFTPPVATAATAVGLEAGV